MAPYRILVAAALSAALGLAGTADATQRTATSHVPAASKSNVAAKTAARPNAKSLAPLAAAVSVGQRYWGAAPCNGNVRVLAGQPLASGLGPATDAWVTFDSSLGKNNLAAPASSYTNCTISFAASGAWPTVARMRADWNMFCTTMTHELGHLLGHAHDAAPGSVMAPVFNDRSSVTQLCRTSRPGRARR